MYLSNVLELRLIVWQKQTFIDKNFILFRFIPSKVMKQENVINPINSNKWWIAFSIDLKYCEIKKKNLQNCILLELNVFCNLVQLGEKNQPEKFDWCFLAKKFNEKLRDKYMKLILENKLFTCAFG